MPNTTCKRGFVIGIIILFIGLAFIPSFNAVSISEDFHKTNLVLDDIENDCFECQSNGKTHLTDKILNKLEKNEVFTNIIKSDNPTFDRPICYSLFETINRLISYAYSLNETLKSLPKDSILRDIIWLNIMMIYGIGTYLESIAYFLKCW